MEIVIVWFIIAFICAAVAGNKGRSVGGWFVLGMLFSFFALIAVALLGSLKPQQVIINGEIATPDTHVRCPDCRELVRADARKCKHCGVNLIPQ